MDVGWGEPTGALGTLFHLFMASFNAVLLRKVRAAARDNSAVYDPEGQIPEYGGQFKYLTHINLWAQLFYFTFQFLTDLLPESFNSKDNIQSHLSLAFTTVIFPMACYVAFSFWAVYTYNADLTYREVSPLLNHLSHTAIVVWVVLEVLMCRHEFPSLSFAAVPILACCFLYILWVEWIHMLTGFWVYPIFNTLPRTLVCFVSFYAFSISICLGLFLVGKMISIYIWG